MIERAQSLFFTRKTSYDQSRFEASEELTHVNALLAELHRKEEELSKAAKENGAQSADYAKHDVVQKLLAQMDKKINAFNEEPVERISKEDDEATKERIKGTELEAICNLVEELLKQVNDVKDDKDKKVILATHRDSNRETANTMVKTGLFASAFTAAFFAPVTLLITVPAAYFGARAANEKVTEMAGLNKTLTRSEELINELSVTLDEVQKNITNKLMGMNRRLVKNAK